MKSKNTFCGLVIAVALQLGMLAGSAQTNIYLFSGSETNITLPQGTYIITTYGAWGGWYENIIDSASGGAEMSGEFNFSAPTTLTLLVGGVGGNVSTVYNYDGGGGGGGSFVVEGSTPLVVAGGGGGSGFDSLVGITFSGSNGTVTTVGGAGGGDAGGSGGAGGGGGTGGDAMLTGFGNLGEGAAGGGGFYTDGTGGRSVFGYALPAGGSPLPPGGSAGGGGLSFEDGGAGGLSNLGGPFTGNGGFGGGGGGYSDNNYGFGGGGGGYSGGGGGGSSDLTTLIGGGGGGGSFIDSSAIAILDPGPYYFPRIRGNGEIIITAVSTAPAIITTNAAFGFTNGVFGFDVTGPSGSNVLIQASTDLQTWIPVQTNQLGSGLLYFSDSQSTTNLRCFYRAQLVP